MTIIIKCLILLLSLSVPAWATVGVVKFGSGTPVQVCVPSDPNSLCQFDGGVSGTIYDYSGNPLATVSTGDITHITSCSGSPSSCDTYTGNESGCIACGCSPEYTNCSAIGDQPTCEATSGCSDVFNGDCSEQMYPTCLSLSGCSDATGQDCSGLPYPQCTEIMGCSDAGGSCTGTAAAACYGQYWTACSGTPFDGTCNPSASACNTFHAQSVCTSCGCSYN